MNHPILLTGGTGTLGRLVVPRLLSAGHEVRVLTRSIRQPAKGVEYVVGDLATGAGIDEAVTNVETIIHCAGSAKGDQVKAQHLVEAASRAGSPHVVNISVVGADRVPVRSGLDRAAFGYYPAKLAAERVIAGSALPWTTLRATQFHDLMLTMISGMARMPVAPYFSGFRFQPVDADEVATRLVELALAKPAGLVPDLGARRSAQPSN